MENQLYGSISVAVCLVFMFLAWRFFQRDNNRLSLFCIILGGAALRLFAGSDGYLHTWDEKYHALVVKHTAEDPLAPKLYADPPLDYEHKLWTSNHVWLTKPPVPLWTMAATSSVFGHNLFGLRFPGFVLSLLAIYLTFLIARRLFDEKVALLAAFLHAINGLVIEVAGGRVSSDHIETFSIFFVELGMYVGILCILRSFDWRRFALLGLITGIAVMCKWFPSLLVLPVWFLAALQSGRFNWKQILSGGAIALTFCALVWVPWVMYILDEFPEDAQWALSQALFAYADPVEMHIEPWYFYGYAIPMIYGEAVWVILILGVYQLIKNKTNWQVGFLTWWWLIPFLIFSLAETKRHTYMLILAPALFVLIAYYWFYLKDKMQRFQYPWMITLVLIVLLALPIRYSIERIQPFDRKGRHPAWVKEIKEIPEKIEGTENVVLFNVLHHIETMYFTDITTYEFQPTPGMVQYLQGEGYRVIINDDGNLDPRLMKETSAELKSLCSN